MVLSTILIAIEGWSLRELQKLNSSVVILQSTSATKEDIHALNLRVSAVESKMQTVPPRPLP